MGYRHTQRGNLHYILFAVFLLLIVDAYQVRGLGFAPYLLLIIAALILFLSKCFTNLTIEDQGDCLSVRFGPIPVFGTKIPYSAIHGVQPDRMSLIDAWGIHWIPGRGWSYRLWGPDCVRLDVGPRTVRLGSDDVAGLVEFLTGRIGKTTTIH